MVVVLLNSVRKDADQDLAEGLYVLYGERLRRIVRARVRAPEAVVEEACQIAWSRFVQHRRRVRRETALAWLATTAVHEALRLLARADRELPLAALPGAGDEPGPASPAPSLEELVTLRERLGAIGALSERQQRLLWLQGFGLSYAEMAQRTGVTPRTVERQLLRAKGKLRVA